MTETQHDPATAIRLHRAFSWMERCEADEPLDVQLICLWVAFNGLYGQWDETRREPMPDRDGWQTFISRLCALDASGHIGLMLQANRDRVNAVFEDEYVSGFFWQEPTDQRASQSRKARYDSRTWYLESKWCLILTRVLERVYLLRCQLVHGAATCGGKLNRDSLQQCVALMRHVMNAVLMVMIDHGRDEDWGALCYPPLS